MMELIEINNVVKYYAKDSNWPVFAVVRKVTRVQAEISVVDGCWIVPKRIRVRKTSLKYHAERPEVYGFKEVPENNDQLIYNFLAGR